MQLLPMASSPDGLISARYAVITKTPGWGVLTTTSNDNNNHNQPADQDSNRRPKTLRRLRYHSTGGCVIALSFPTAWSLLSENF